MTTKSEGMMIPGKLKWYVILALALWLVFCGMAAAEQLCVNESGWWRDGGAFNASTAPIQAAVDAAAAGDSIYVYGGRYDENVNVDKTRLTLVGAGADVVTVTAGDSGDYVFWVSMYWVNISGFAVRGATDSGVAGIYLDNVNYCDISENNAYGNGYGIYLYSSSKNTLESNTVNSNYNGGISMSSSSNNTLTNNNVSSNSEGGIYLRDSSNNTLTGNSASDNKWHYGIRIRCSNNNTLTDNTVSNNGGGICIDDSDNNTLGHNNCSNNGDGIYLRDSSSNNRLTDNNASDNTCGTSLRDSSSNMLANNTINSNNYGIRLYNADHTHITCNWVHHNTQYGFYLSSGSTGNNISYNNIIENGNYNAATDGWEWQFCINQYQPVEAKHNYWGSRMNNGTIDASIHDDEEGWGEVEFYPFETEPVPCAPAPTPEEPPAFTTTDAAIALQIAVGSRPPGLRWDVNGDDSVTSLDALMILQAVMQAAAGNPEYPITGCKDLDQSILRMYDDDGDGRIDDQWTINAGIDLDEGRITQSEYDQVKYAYEHNCPVETE